MNQHIFDGELIGGAVYQGLTYGGSVLYAESGTFEKADYPGLRAIRVGGAMMLASDLDASIDIAGLDTVEAVEDTNVNTTSTTFQAGSPECGIVFTAPASGAVWIDWGGFLQLDLTTTNSRRGVLGWELREGATIGSGSVVVAAADVTARVVGLGVHGGNSNQWHYAGGARYPVTGLTPGDPYNVRTMHRVSSTGITITCFERRISAVPLGGGLLAGLVELWY